MIMRRPFQRIVLMSRPGRFSVADTLSTIYHHLLHLEKKVIIEEHTKAFFSPSPESSEFSLTDADLLLVVGGDGSLLQGAQIALQYGLPILGVNRGTLGFLTDIKPQELTKITEVVSGKYSSEERFLLEATIEEGASSLTQSALNDVVIHRGIEPQLIDFNVYINNHLVCHQRSDGIIIATPTGSTAYALSAGGPIVHPALNVIVLVPMFPHTLSSRPIVINGHDTITIEINPDSSLHSNASLKSEPPRKQTPDLSCDGHTRLPLPSKSRVLIREKQEKLTLIHPLDYDYFATLRSKLGWETKYT